MLAGVAVTVLIAGVAATVYALAQPRSAPHASTLPRRPISIQSVGLVTVAPSTSVPAGGQPLQLVAGHAAPEFSPVAAAQAAEGLPQWTADLMGGGSYIFIFLQTGQCLTAAGAGSRPRLALEHCDLGIRQRWRRVGGALLAGGHDFYQYASSGDGKCLTMAGPLADGNNGTSLAACARARRASQLISFWWSSA